MEIHVQNTKKLNKLIKMENESKLLTVFILPITADSCECKYYSHFEQVLLRNGLKQTEVPFLFAKNDVSYNDKIWTILSDERNKQHNIDAKYIHIDWAETTAICQSEFNDAADNAALGYYLDKRLIAEANESQI